MSDPRMKAGGVKLMTDGTRWVDVELTFTIDGNKLTISDRSSEPVGDACAALHFAALQTIGAEILEARNTDAFERKPEDPGGVVRGETSVQAGRG